MTDDTKSASGNANSPNKAFNSGQKLAHDIANLSPDGQKLCKEISKVSAERMQAEKDSQKRSHNYRVMKSKVELMEKYILDQSSRPAEIRANPEPDLKIIHEEAERMVREKEEFYLLNIEREADANLRQVVAMERGGYDFSQGDLGHEDPDLEH